MLQAKIVEPRKIILEETAIPSPKKNEILVKVRYNAICGSEFSPYLGLATVFPHYLGKAEYPFGPFGHEGVGEIVEVGKAVKNFKVGDKIIGGGYAEYAIVNPSGTVVIPDGIDLKYACLTTTVFETYYATRWLKINKNDVVCIFGMGPTGILLLEQVREIGCKMIICVDPLDARLTMAKSLGATATINPVKDDLFVKIKDTVKDGPTVVIDTSSKAQAIVNAIKIVAKFGKVGLYARPVEKIDGFEIEDIVDKMIEVYGLKTKPDGYTPKYMTIALAMIKNSKIDAQKLITHEYALRNINEAFEMAAVKKEGLKTVIRC